MRSIDTTTKKDRELEIDTSTGGLLAKLVGAITVTLTGIADLATAAKQDTGNTTLASILAKIIAAPATEAKQDTGNTSLATIAAAQPFLKPPGSHTEITPSDATDITAIASIGLLCTVAGSLSVRGATTTGTTVTFDVVAGQYIYGAFSRVMGATTATVVGLAP